MRNADSNTGSFLLVWIDCRFIKKPGSFVDPRPHLRGQEICSRNQGDWHPGWPSKTVLSRHENVTMTVTDWVVGSDWWPHSCSSGSQCAVNLGIERLKISMKREFGQTKRNARVVQQLLSVIVLLFFFFASSRSLVKHDAPRVARTSPMTRSIAGRRARSHMVIGASVQVIPWCRRLHGVFFLTLTQHISHNFGHALWQFDTNILSPSSRLFSMVHLLRFPGWGSGIVPMADVEMLVWDGWLIGILVIIRLAGSDDSQPW